MKNQKTMGNKGFSLVELIVVIAIMVVLVAVLAPTFLKYVEQSRRSTDVQNANSVADGVLTDAADESLPTTAYNGDKTEATKDTVSSLKSTPTVKAKSGPAASGSSFYYVYNKGTNTVAVYAGDDTHDLTNENQAKEYKDYSAN